MDCDRRSGLAAKAATSTTPIAFGKCGDPVEQRLVFSLFADELMNKRLELLHGLLPATIEIAMAVDLNNPAAEWDLSTAQ